MALPLVAVTLVSHAGYFQRGLSPSGEQQEPPDFWDLAAHAIPLDARIGVQIGGHPVGVTGWLYVQEYATGSRVPVILLDTDLPENFPEDRDLAHRLYGGDKRYRLKQELLLGVGSIRLLAALGFPIRHCHMNQGHAALLTPELVR